MADTNNIMEDLRRRMAELESRQNKLDIRQAETNVKIDNMREDVNHLTKTVDTRLTSVSKALWAGFTVFLTAFLSIVGLILAQGGVH